MTDGVFEVTPIELRSLPTTVAMECIYQLASAAIGTWKKVPKTERPDIRRKRLGTYASRLGIGIKTHVAGDWIFVCRVPPRVKREKHQKRVELTVLASQCMKNEMRRHGKRVQDYERQSTR